MIWDCLLIFLVVSGVVLIVWCILGILLKPVFCEDMISYLPVTGDAEGLELRVNAYAWLREGRLSGGKLVLIDQGLSEIGTSVVEQLCREYHWLVLESGKHPEQ